MRATDGAGSTLRLVATALNGAAAGNAAGGLGGLVRGAAVNVPQGLAVNQVKNRLDTIADAATRETTRAALQAVVGCAGAAAGGSGNCGAAATGAAAGVVFNHLLKSDATTSVGPDGKPLGRQDQQARTDLVATIVAGWAKPWAAVPRRQPCSPRRSRRRITARP